MHSFVEWVNFLNNLQKIFYHSCLVKLATVVKGNQKASFSIATKPMCRGGRHFTLDMYLISLSVWQGGIKYHF